MTSNKITVEKYMDAFGKTDKAAVLDCLTDDVEWLMPGFFHLHGKEAFSKEIRNDAFIGDPNIITTRLIEENNVVVAEGSVTSQMKNGGMLDAVFCDVFEMENGKIKKLISYLMQRQGVSSL